MEEIDALFIFGVSQNECVVSIIQSSPVCFLSRWELSHECALVVDIRDLDLENLRVVRAIKLHHFFALMVCAIAPLPEKWRKAATHTDRVVANASIRAVYLAKIAHLSRVAAASRSHVETIELVNRCERVVSGGAVAFGAVGSKPFWLLRLARPETYGPRRVTDAAEDHIAVP